MKRVYKEKNISDNFDIQLICHNKLIKKYFKISLKAVIKYKNLNDY